MVETVLHKLAAIQGHHEKSDVLARLAPKMVPTLKKMSTHMMAMDFREPLDDSQMQLGNLLAPWCTGCEEHVRQVKLCMSVSDLTKKVSETEAALGQDDGANSLNVLKKDSVVLYGHCLATLCVEFPVKCQQQENLMGAIDRAKEKLLLFKASGVDDVKVDLAKATDLVNEKLGSEEAAAQWPAGFDGTEWPAFIDFTAPVLGKIDTDELQKGLSEMYVALRKASEVSNEWKGFGDGEFAEYTAAKALFQKAHTMKLEGFCMFLLTQAAANPISLRKKFNAALKDTQQELGDAIEGAAFDSSSLHPMIKKQLEVKMSFSGASAKAKAKAQA